MIRHSGDFLGDPEFIKCLPDRVSDASTADVVMRAYYVADVDKRIEALSSDAYARLSALVEDIAGEFDFLLQEYRRNC